MSTTYVNDITYTTKIESIDCVSHKCGIVYGLSAEFIAARRKDHRSWFCPNGHSQYFPGKTDEERAIEERDAARSLAERESQRRRAAEKTAEHERRAAAAHKGWATRIRNRIANGVCPCCNRSFENVRRHIESQHPDFQVPTS